MLLAAEIMLNCAQTQWSEKKPLELKSFSNDIVETLGTLKTAVCCDDWKIHKAKITVVADGFRPILGRDLFDQLGKTISQKTCPKTEINNIETPCAIKKSLPKEFPELISRVGKSKHRSVNLKFQKKLSSYTSKREESAHSPPNKSKN